MMRRGIQSRLASTAVLAIPGVRHQVVPPRRPLHINDNFMSGVSADVLDEMYVKWQQDPSTVDESFHGLFESMSTDFESPVLENPIRVMTNTATQAQSLSDSGRLGWMIQCFEHRGHLLASLDPLSYEDDPNHRIPARAVKESLRVDTEFFGFVPEDNNKTFNVGVHENLGGLLDTTTPPMTLNELHNRLVKTYCGNIGWDYSHVDETAVNKWLRENIETPERVPNSAMAAFPPAERIAILEDLAAAVKFEQFFDKKFYMQKRFGLDGGESLVVGLEHLIERASANGTEEFVIGMAHRGRLSSLHNIAGKPFPAIVKEFTGLTKDDFKGIDGQGDVKYHLGWRKNRTLRNGKDVLVEMMYNPSHLECVNPLVQGRTRASQVGRGDEEGKKVLPIEIHGDAAFAGQGVCFESMGLSELTSSHTGGTIHVVVNNQIGFTTDPKSSRSSAHCTDLGRVFHCPVFHVNGDKPEDVVRVFKLAADYRAKFRRSVVIDLVCYRRYGHNESDDPTVTQPLMYARIKQRKDIFTLYSNELVEGGVLTADMAKSIGQKVTDKYMAGFEEAKTYDYPHVITTRSPQWEALRKHNDTPKFFDTKLTKAQLEPVIKAINKLPEGFKLHKVLEGIMTRRGKAVTTGEGLDWGAAEALALGSILNEGTHVRISGQDVERATFSQRHAVLHDQKTDETYTALNHISKDQAKFVVKNSSLSEFGVLGFESGYSIYHPNQFVMWEAQFGDFANGAQIIFDNFLAAGESKWNVPYCPVVSMPHGYDGNGPEHSSGRIERFLQLCNEDEDTIVRDITKRAIDVNMEVTYPSTPAQYYNLIRRHVHRNFRKPWINFWSKAFLRAPNLSSLDDCINNEFKTILPDVSGTSAQEAKYVILCSGQVYFYLEEERAKLQRNDVHIIRVEQLAPFPAVEIEELLAKYPKDVTIRWVQEEPKNMGAWGYAEPRLHTVVKYEKEISYVGRPTAASPAAGFKKLHDVEHAAVLRGAFAQ